MPDSGSRPSSANVHLRNILKLKKNGTRKSRSRSQSPKIPNQSARANAHLSRYLKRSSKRSSRSRSPARSQSRASSNRRSSPKKMMWVFHEKPVELKEFIQGKFNQNAISVTLELPDVVNVVSGNSSVTFRLNKKSGKITATADGDFLNREYIPAILIVKESLEKKQFIGQTVDE